MIDIYRQTAVSCHLITLYVDILIEEYVILCKILLTIAVTYVSILALYGHIDLKNIDINNIRVKSLVNSYDPSS